VPQQLHLNNEQGLLDDQKVILLYGYSSRGSSSNMQLAAAAAAADYTLLYSRSSRLIHHNQLESYSNSEHLKQHCCSYCQCQPSANIFCSQTRLAPASLTPQHHPTHASFPQQQFLHTATTAAHILSPPRFQCAPPFHPKYQSTLWGPSPVAPPPPPPSSSQLGPQWYFPTGPPQPGCIISSRAHSHQRGPYCSPAGAGRVHGTTRCLRPREAGRPLRLHPQTRQAGLSVPHLLAAARQLCVWQAEARRACNQGDHSPPPG